jgi:hypothetical protein
LRTRLISCSWLLPWIGRFASLGNLLGLLKRGLIGAQNVVEALHLLGGGGPLAALNPAQRFRTQSDEGSESALP